MPAEFVSPPINEVVISTYFNPPLTDFHSEHVGLFWERIKNEFPIVQQHPPVGLDLEVASDGLFPMPRYWFISHNEVNLIQFQKNAFMYNWRRRSEEDQYPGYHAGIKPTFDKYYGVFVEFVRKEISGDEPKVDLCELSYINTLEQNDFWGGLHNTPLVIPSFSILNLETGSSETTESLGMLGFNCNYGHFVSPDMQVHVGIRSGNKKQQPDVPILVFEIKGSGRLGQITKSGADEWFDRAHDVVENSFVGMTSKEVRHDVWKQSEEGI